MAASGMTSVETEGCRERGGGSFNDVDERRGDAEKYLERGRHEQREAVGFFEGEIFGDDFADDDVDEADGQKSERKS